MKKIISVTIAVFIFISAMMQTGAAATLIINEDNVNCFIEGGVTYAAVRDFAHQYKGYSVGWSDHTRTATIEGNGLNARIFQGKEYIIANDRVLCRNARIKNINGRLYAPVTLLAEAVSAEVSWHQHTRTATVTGGGFAIASGDSYYNSHELYWLSRIISAESRGESFMGMAAVGSVVMNRVASPHFPDTVKEVIFDRKYGVQFTPIENGSIYDTPTEQSVLAAKAVLDGFLYSDKILYFVDPKKAPDSWAERNRPYAFTLGNHAFYY